MKKIKKLGGVLLAFVMLFSVSLAACNFGNNDEDKGAITGLYFVTEGLKTTYNVGETFDESQVKLTAVYERGSESLTLSSEGVTKSWSPELNKDAAGTYKLTATYKQKSVSLDFTYLEKENTVLVSISIKPMTTAFVKGAEFDESKITIVAAYSDGTTREIAYNAEGVEISKPDLSTIGEKPLTISYTESGVTKTYTVTLTVAETLAPKALAYLSLDTSTLTTHYMMNDEFDFSDVEFTAVYNTGEYKTVKMSDGVTMSPQFSTVTPGDFPITFSYTEGGVTKTYTVTLTVTAPAGTVVTSFEAPQEYMQFVARQKTPGDYTRDDRFTYLKAMETYKVGVDNAFVLTPDVRAINLDTKTPFQFNTAKTTFKLLKKGDRDKFDEVEDLSEYLMTEEEVKTARKENGVTEETYTKSDSYYFFKEKAVGSIFQLEITLSEEHKSETNVVPFTVEFEVVNGYNVYDQTGLSVLDNLNVKHWAAIKTAAGALAWDLKPLKDYNSIADNEITEQVIFHKNIEIDPDQLPDRYFWDKDRAELKEMYEKAYGDLNTDAETKANGYPDLLNGSLRDWDSARGDGWFNFDSDSQGDQKEDYNALRINMQKGIYNIAGTFIEGNGMTLSYKTDGSKHHLYTVYDNDWDTSGGSLANFNANPTGHWSFFKYVDEKVVSDAYPKANFEKNVVIRNLTIEGNQQRLSESTGEKPELMGANSATDNIALENCIISQVYVATVADHGDQRSNIDVKHTKIFDVFSNMFYLWRSDLTITDSILKEAGGPIAILCDGDRSYNKEDGQSWDPIHPDGTRADEDGSHMLVTDDASVLESLAGGSEPWYMLNKANLLFTQLKAQILEYVHTGTGRELQHTDEKGNELFNVIAVLICDPGDLMGRKVEDPMLYPSGWIRRGTEGNYTDNYNMNYSIPKQMELVAGFNTILQSIPGTMAPMFHSGTAKAIYIGDALGSSTNYLGLGKDDVVTTSASVINEKFSSESTDWMFVTMRADANDPRFGILFGGVTEYKAEA